MEPKQQATVLIRTRKVQFMATYYFAGLVVTLLFIFMLVELKLIYVKCNDYKITYFIY